MAILRLSREIHAETKGILPRSIWFDLRYLSAQMTSIVLPAIGGLKSEQGFRYLNYQLSPLVKGISFAFDPHKILSSEHTFVGRLLRETVNLFEPLRLTFELDIGDRTHFPYLLDDLDYGENRLTMLKACRTGLRYFWDDEDAGFIAALLLDSKAFEGVELNLFTRSPNTRKTLRDDAWTLLGFELLCTDCHSCVKVTATDRVFKDGVHIVISRVQC